MDIRPNSARFLGIALLTAVAAAVSQPEAVQAQEEAALQTGSAPTITDEKLGQYAKLHLAITTARDEFQASKAAVHDLAARERLREEMDERLGSLYDEHGMSKAEYDGITFMVSIDNDARTRLDQLLSGTDPDGDGDDGDGGARR